MKLSILCSALIVAALLAAGCKSTEASEAPAPPAPEPTAAQEEATRMQAEQQAGLDAQAEAARELAKAQEAERAAAARLEAERLQKEAEEREAAAAEEARKVAEQAEAARAAEAAEAKLKAEAALKAEAEKAGTAAGSKEDAMALASGDVVAVLETSAGTMVLGFFPETAPGHVKNFTDLAQKGFYDGTRFHRTIAGFMVQGGDPFSKDLASSARWGTGDAGYKIKAEFSAKPHQRGTLSMARSRDPDSAGSQFFICHQAAPHLDRQYTVFGELLAGYDVLDRIATAPVLPGTDRPKDPVQLVKVTIRPRTATDVKEGG